MLLSVSRYFFSFRTKQKLVADMTWTHGRESSAKGLTLLRVFDPLILMIAGGGASFCAWIVAVFFISSCTFCLYFNIWIKPQKPKQTETSAAHNGNCNGSIDGLIGEGGGGACGGGQLIRPLIDLNGTNSFQNYNYYDE